MGEKCFGVFFGGGGWVGVFLFEAVLVFVFWFWGVLLLFVWFFFFSFYGFCFQGKTCKERILCGWEFWNFFSVWTTMDDVTKL